MRRTIRGFCSLLLAGQVACTSGVDSEPTPIPSASSTPALETPVPTLPELTPTLQASPIVTPTAVPVPPPCGLVVQGVPASVSLGTGLDGAIFALEGQPLELQVTCASGKPATDFELKAEALPPGAVLEPASWGLEWTPAGDQAGLWVLPLTATSRADPQTSETVDLQISVADNPAGVDQVPVDPTLYLEEWGVPVMHLQPSGALSEAYVATTITWRGQSILAELKLRGASSLYYAKNSYLLRFPEELELDLNAEGLGTKRRLVLTSTFDDNSYVRQKLAFDTWRDLASFWEDERLTVRTFFVVVYLSGTYHGLYLASDHVDDEFIRQMGLDKTGNVYKAVNHDANFYLTNASGYPKYTLHDGYEKKEGTPVEGEDTAFADLDALVAFAGTATHSAFMRQVDFWMHQSEFMDWFLFVHFIAADDSGGKNAYLYNLPSEQEFRYCPWDFNHAFGQAWETSRVPADSYNDFIWTNAIFAHFQNDAAASDVLWSRLQAELATGPLSCASLREKVDAYYAQIGSAAQRDWGVWAESYYAYWSWSRNGSDWTDFEQERALLYQWLEDRCVYMNAVHG